MENLTAWEKEINLNHFSSRPLYIQVKEALETWIINALHEGSLCPGDRLPSENELSEKLDVSPITIKRALDELRRQGLIYRIQGRGTFVAEQNKIALPLTHLYSLTNLTLEKGMIPGRRTLQISEMEATPRLAERLKIDPSSKVIKLVRLRLMNDIPLGLDTTFLPSPLFPNFIARYEENISLYEMMEKYYGQNIARAQDLISPILLRSTEANLLEVPSGSLAFLFQRLAYNKTDQPLESTKSVIRSDLFCISIEFLRNENEHQ